MQTVLTRPPILCSTINPKHVDLFVNTGDLSLQTFCPAWTQQPCLEIRMQWWRPSRKRGRWGSRFRESSFSITSREWRPSCPPSPAWAWITAGWIRWVCLTPVKSVGILQGHFILESVHKYQVLKSGYTYIFLLKIINILFHCINIYFC